MIIAGTRPPWLVTRRPGEDPLAEPEAADATPPDVPVKSAVEIAPRRPLD
jgi:hypothetical protein